MLIAVLNQKGGVGKSTTAVHLARWLQLQGRAIHLGDLDPQQTSSVWLAAADGCSVPCSAIPPDCDSVLEQLPPLLEGGRVVVVDGPAGLTEATRAVSAPAAADGEARVRFTVDLPRSLHKRLKLAAVDRELPMSDLARQALGELLKGLD